MLGMTGRTLIQRNMETFDVISLGELLFYLEKLQHNKIERRESLCHERP